jgi:hypothetical protein
MKMLSLLRENALLAEGGAKERTGIFTTGILAQVGEHRIILFFTGRKHAGENLQSVLEQRQDGLPAPIQMCDGSSSNQVNSAAGRLQFHQADSQKPMDGLAQWARQQIEQKKVEPNSGLGQGS